MVTDTIRKIFELADSLERGGEDAEERTTHDQRGEAEESECGSEGKD